MRLRKPNLGPNSGKQMLDARILDPNSQVEFFDSWFFQQKRTPEKFTLKKFTSQNSPSKIQPRNRAKKIHLAPLQGYFADFLGKRGKMCQKCVKSVSKMRQLCAKNASKMRQNTFGGEHLLDDTPRSTPGHSQHSRKGWPRALRKKMYGSLSALGPPHSCEYSVNALLNEPRFPTSISPFPQFS